MKKKGEKQGSLFSEETGSPLFSNSPMRVEEDAFVPEPANKQKNLFGQPTMETMQSAAQRKICPHCDQLIEVSNGGRFVEHGPDGKLLKLFAAGQVACRGSNLKA